MAIQDTYQSILLNLKTLPDEKVKEVLDFINFLKAKEQSVKDQYILSQFNALKEDWEADGMQAYDEL